jgi:cytosine/adenosine deaminase-related metal-dependent hydrolase
MDERLATRRRGNFDVGELLAAATATGQASLGWPDAGRIAAGALADLVTVGLDSPRLAGIEDPLAAAIFAGGDVRQVFVGGKQIVRDAQHHLITDVAGELRAAIAAVVGG